MIYIKKFNESEMSIEDWCENLSISFYTINDDTVDVNWDVILCHRELSKIPIQFGIVKGNFDCGYNKLRTLEGAPKIVNKYFNCAGNLLTSLIDCPNKIGDDFYCRGNLLTSLENSPEKVNGDFTCYNNKLTSLIDGPINVEGSFNCSSNQLTSLIGGPINVKGSFNCNYNNIKSLEGYPEKLGGFFYHSKNPIDTLINLFDSLKKYKLSIEEYNYQRVDKIYRKRLERACIDAEIQMPDFIPGYEFI
jgi:hypothetical protein